MSTVCGALDVLCYGLCFWSARLLITQSLWLRLCVWVCSALPIFRLICCVGRQVPDLRGDLKITILKEVYRLKMCLQDSLQAFSSSIAGLLTSRAVLEGKVHGSYNVFFLSHCGVGVGVGDANASPTAALLLSVLQDSMGRLATIGFAHKLGTALEPECKMYRLLADVFNDIAMILDCLSPALPKVPRVVLLSVSSILRALCGVAAGSSKASLSAHFAKWGNLGELNAVRDCRRGPSAQH